MTHDEALAILGPHPADCPEVPRYQDSPHHRCLWVEELERLVAGDREGAGGVTRRWCARCRRPVSPRASRCACGNTRG